MANSKNIALLIGGGTALGLGLIYFTYNKYTSISNNSTSGRSISVDSSEGVGDLPDDSTPPLEEQRRTTSNESNDSTSTYGEFFSGGSKNKKRKGLRKTKNNKRKKDLRKTKKIKGKKKIFISIYE